MAIKSPLCGALLFSLAACAAGGVTSSLPNYAQRAARTTSSYAIAYSFRGAPDGYVPMGGLVSDDSGLLYGVTNYGGATPRGCNGSAGCGTFFHFIPSRPHAKWTQTLHIRLAGAPATAGIRAVQSSPIANICTV